MRAQKVVYMLHGFKCYIFTHTRVCAKFLNSSFILVRAFTLMNVKILTFGNSNIYFIYFNTFLYSTPNINNTIYIFFFSVHLNIFSILFLLSFSLPLWLFCFSVSFSSLKSEPRSTIQPQPSHHNQATCHQQLHNSEKTFHCQIPTTRSHNKEKAYTRPGKKGGRWSVVTHGQKYKQRNFKIGPANYLVLFMKR